MKRFIILKLTIKKTPERMSTQNIHLVLVPKSQRTELDNNENTTEEEEVKLDTNKERERPKPGKRAAEE